MIISLGYGRANGTTESIKNARERNGKKCSGSQKPHKGIWYTPLIPAGIYMLKVNNRNISTRCEISKLTIKTPEQQYFTPCSSAFVVNFEHVIDN